MCTHLEPQLHFDIEVVDRVDTAPPGPNNIFAIIDENEDGFLDREEVEAYFKNIMGREVPEALWDKHDKDKDGKISWEEFRGPKG